LLFGTNIYMPITVSYPAQLTFGPYPDPMQIMAANVVFKAYMRVVHVSDDAAMVEGNGEPPV
jgi:hypothetical protein